MFNGKGEKQADRRTQGMRTQQRTRMKQADRAKQFMPFSALKGLEEAIEEAGTVREPRRELLDDEAEELNRGLNTLEEGDEIMVKYYTEGGYVTKAGIVKGLDRDARMLETDGAKIKTDDICRRKILEKKDFYNIP